MTFAYSSANTATAISGSISGTTLTVTARTGTVYVNTVLVATGVTSTQILKQLTGTAGSTGTYTVANSQTVASFTAGVARADLITQSGTDTSLAGLTGITGVTVTPADSNSGYIGYSLGTNALVINGILTVAGSVAPNEQFVGGFNSSVNAGTVSINGQVCINGTIHLGASQTNNGITDGFQNQVLMYQPGSGKGQADGTAQSASIGNGANAFLFVTATGTLNWNYGTISCWGGIGFHPTATVNIGVAGKKLKPVLDLNRARATFGQTQSQTVYSYCPVNMQGLIMMGGASASDATALGAVWVQAGVPTAFNNFEPRFCRVALGGSNNMPSGTYIIENYAGNYGGFQDISKRAAAPNNITLILKNSALGTSNSIGSNNISGVFLVKDYRDLNVSAADGGVVCFSDSAGVLYQATVTGGTAQFQNVVVGEQLNTNDTVWTRYFDTTDTASLSQWAYDREYASSSVAFRKIAPASANIASPPDLYVTLSKTAANAKLASSFTVNTATNTITVTADSTYNDLYDALKAWKCTPLRTNLLYPTIDTKPVNAAGTAVITAMDITVNPGVTLSAGATFKSLVTSGSLNSSGIISGNIEATSSVMLSEGASFGTGSLKSGFLLLPPSSMQNLTNYEITGDIIAYTDTPITLTFTNSKINTSIGNLGLGLITINLTNSSVVGENGNIVVQQPATLTVQVSQTGSDIVITTPASPDGSGSNVLATFDAISGTTATYNYIVGRNPIVNVHVYKTGYKDAHTLNYALGANSSTLPFSQLADRDYI